MKPRQTLILGIVVALFIVGIIVYQKVLIPHREKTGVVEAYPEFSGDDAVKLEVSRGDYRAELAKKDGNWVVVTEGDYPADEEGILKGLEIVRELDTENFISGDPEKQGRFEISDEEGLRVKISGADDRVLADFLIGKRGPASLSYYYRKAGEDGIYLAYTNLLDTFNRQNSSWKDKTILKFLSDDAREFEAVSEEGAIRLEKNLEKDAWEMVEGENRVQAKKWVVNDLVSSLARFNALEFPEEQDLKEVGLEDSGKKVTVKLADGTVLTLLIGDEKESAGRTYVKRADSPTLFLVSSYQANKFFKKKEELIEEPKEEGEEEEPSFLPPPVLEKPPVPPE